MGLQAPFRRHDGETVVAAAVLKFAENLQLSPGDFGGGVKELVGGSLACGVQLGGSPPHQVEQSCPAPRLFQRWDHHQHGLLSPLCQCTGHQRAGHASAPTHQEAFRPLTALEQFTGQRRRLEQAHQGTQRHGCGSGQSVIFASDWAQCLVTAQPRFGQPLL